MVRRGWSIKQGHGRGEVRLDVSLESQAKVLELNLEDTRGIAVLLTEVAGSNLQLKKISRFWKEVNCAARLEGDQFQSLEKKWGAGIQALVGALRGTLRVEEAARLTGWCVPCCRWTRTSTRLPA